jgi:hypothetical protein
MEQIEIHTSTSLQGLFGWLNSQGYQFGFLTMRDYTDCEPLWSVIKSNHHRHIKLMEFQGMMEFVRYHDATKSKQDPHPSRDGHGLIAQRVLDMLEHTAQG